MTTDAQPPNDAVADAVRGDAMNPDLTAADCERIFREALGRGDARGVESALTLLAVHNPQRAQTLMDQAKVTLRVVDDLRDADSDLRDAIADELWITKRQATPRGAASCGQR